MIYHIDRMKDKNLMTLSIKAKEKVIDKIQHSFMIKTFNIFDTEGIICHKLIKTLYISP
jgi:hypothetical protein